MTAHPKICPRTGELHFIEYGSLTSPYVTYHRANALGELIINGGIDVPKLTMMHDFALSAKHRAHHPLGPAGCISARYCTQRFPRHAIPLERRLRRPTRSVAPR